MEYLKIKKIVYVNDKYGCIVTEENLIFYFSIAEYKENISSQGFDQWTWFIWRDNFVQNKEYSNKFFVKNIDKSNFSNINYGNKHSKNTNKLSYLEPTTDLFVAKGTSYEDVEYLDPDDELSHEIGTSLENYSYYLGEDEPDD